MVNSLGPCLDKTLFGRSAMKCLRDMFFAKHLFHFDSVILCEILFYWIINNFANINSRKAFLSLSYLCILLTMLMVMEGLRNS